jgi:sulfotransferase
VKNGIHFISGLPRSGSTLLAAILRQNPRVHAGMSGPVASLVMALQRQMSGENESSVFIDDVQRRAVLRGVFDSYYAEIHPTKVVIDTSRTWCAKMPLLADLHPAAKVIACVRHMPWVMDSFERLTRKNALEPSGIFRFEPGGTVYSRFTGLTGSDGAIGGAFDALRDAFYGEQSGSLMLLTFQTLTTDPARALKAVYDFIGEPAFAHDFANVEYDAEAFDRRLGTPGLHRVGRVVQAMERETILPPDLFARLTADSFWADPDRNPRSVSIV